jgi:hypothetical protein
MYARARSTGPISHPTFPLLFPAWPAERCLYSDQPLLSSEITGLLHGREGTARAALSAPYAALGLSETDFQIASGFLHRAPRGTA